MVREAHELLDGSRPIPIDKITYELSQNIILAFDNNEHIKRNKDVQIEIEARVIRARQFEHTRLLRL